ncbi:regulatory protein, lacI family [Fontibacillus panacisegetis]|uniref:Regulatory protein, lacI family n=1 Tax=Fontibacillus panacisegetis TaxID=670482 RepID=A0A1G7LWU0_9BACL|nr:LacI family DNA-binding transcriptional regulator [Fontibacillus panacisegetis]SDF54038.1 regulatory protein, lacI family [Fontibacillus panacisegetis]
MDKKITIRDIAKQAGVSVATVSYVINNRMDQRITEETRKKVLQIVNLLDYKPNSSARSLSTSKTYNIALYMMPETSLLKRSEQLLLIEVLSEVSTHYGYHLIIQDNKEFAKLNYVDAILCFDATLDFFLSLGDKNLVPVIAVDCLIDIPWFFQICSDYKLLKKNADQHFGVDNYFYICLTPNNELLKSFICKTFREVKFVKDLKDFSEIANQNYVYNQVALNDLMAGKENSCYIPCDLHSKMDRVYRCIDFAINRIPDMEHAQFV